MGNISYFCIVKHLRHVLRFAVTIFFLLLTNNLRSQDAESIFSNMDSVEISLLTCQPREQIYSLYGHTAIRVKDTADNIDIAVNYGIFSFDKPYFVLRFVFGLTDYEMGVTDFEQFRRNYEADGAGVRQQTLNLTAEEKNEILKALAVNYEPQNRIYRYNYFYDNCTTRARDILVSHIKGIIRYPARNSNKVSYRELIHSYNEHHRWARFGNDLLLGIKADQPINRQEQQFLPDNLRRDFDNAVIVNEDHTKRPLVKQSSWVFSPYKIQYTDFFEITPRMCAVAVAIILIMVTIIERRLKKTFWGIDAFILSVTGICGIILFAMIFSEHPAVSLNFQILLLNPLSLVFLYKTIKDLRMNKIPTWIMAWGVLLILFLIAGFFQKYAEGMYLVALSLLIRYLFKLDQIISIKRK